MAKLTLNTDSGSSAGPKLKLNFKKPSDASASQSSPPAVAPAAAPAEPKPKRKYTRKPKPEAPDDAAGISDITPASVVNNSKKRARKEDDDEAESPAKRPAKLSRIPSMKLKMSNSTEEPPLPKPKTLPKLKIGASRNSVNPATPTLIVKMPRTSTQKLVVKGISGAIPERKVGVGYDSEADDVEIDPMHEHQFILRMQPGEDCDYLRKAIAERKIGMKRSEGGAAVFIQFFDKEARRAKVTIRNNHYAATLVDMPCIVEGLKSWDKRSFMKVADIHQMLLVLGRVNTDEQAKTYELPSSVDKTNYQYAHGLTPPMHYVRKRRFRKRVSHRTIEAVEEEVERLLAADEDARRNGGLSEYQMLDPNARDDSEDREQSEEADAYGEEVQDSIEADAYGEEDDEMARLMAEEFEKDPNAMPGVLISGDGHIHASPDTLQPTDTPASAMSPSDDSSDAESEIEIDDDERELQQERAQQREEIEDIKSEIASVDKQLQEQKNLLLRTRLAEKKQKLNRDLQLKLATLGEEE